MILVDSSGWLEFFTDGPLAEAYSQHLKHLDSVVTPTIVLYEVYKIIKRHHNEEEALAATAQMSKTHIAPLTDTIALQAADVSLSYHLAMADAIVYATAVNQQAKLITSDSDLAPLPGVMYLKKP